MLHGALKKIKVRAKVLLYVPPKTYNALEHQRVGPNFLKEKSIVAFILFPLSQPLYIYMCAYTYIFIYIPYYTIVAAIFFSSER